MPAPRLAVLLAAVVTTPLLLVGIPTAHAGAAPTAVITSPADGSFADGTIDVTTEGTADASVGDQAVSMILLVDYAPYASASCPSPASGSCSLTFAVNADALTQGGHWLQVELQTNTDTGAISAPIAVGARSPLPSVGLRVLSPVSYATTGGGSIGGFADASAWTRQAGLPVSLQLLLDGSPVGTAASCPPSVVGQSPCSKTLFGRAGSGTHTVQVRLTVGSTTLDSAPRTTTVLAPTVAVTSPAPGTVVRGTVSVTVVGTVAGPEDKAVSLGLAHNGAIDPQQTTTCDPTAATCTATFQEDASVLHSLTGTFTTSHLTVRSPQVVVTAYTNELLWVYGTTVQSGHLATINGGLGGSLGAVPAGTPITVRFAPAHGKATTVHVPLRSNGSFSLHYRPTTNTRLTASLAGGAAYSGASTTSVLLVTPAPQCRLPSLLHRGTLTLVTCSVPYLPKGTRVTLQFSAHKHWYTAVARPSTAGKATLPFHWSRKQTLWVRVVIAANKDFAAYVGTPFAVHVS